MITTFSKENGRMKEEFVKEKKIDKKQKEEMNRLLIQSILYTNNMIEVARKNYEFAEGELIDYYLYEIKANQSKLNYLIKKSKKNGLELDRVQQLQMIHLEENQVG